MNSGKNREILGNWRLRFPEDRGVRIFFISLWVVVLLSIGILSYEFAINFSNFNKNRVERAKVEAEVDFWNKVLGKYPNFRDAYYQRSVLEYRLGEKIQAERDIQKVLEIDPNFEPALKLEEILKN